MNDYQFQTDTVRPTQTVGSVMICTGQKIRRRRACGNRDLASTGGNHAESCQSTDNRFGFEEFFL